MGDMKITEAQLFAVFFSGEMCSWEYLLSQLAISAFLFYCQRPTDLKVEFSIAQFCNLCSLIDQLCGAYFNK